MALVSTSGPNSNVESDVALASAGTIVATRMPVAGRPVTVQNVTFAPISTASGAQCGKLTLKDGAIVIATYYIFFTATAASQAVSQTFPVGLTFSPATNITLLYTAVTDATTASASVVWG